MANTLLALLTIGTQIGAVILLIAFGLNRKGRLVRFVADYRVALAFCIVVAATGLSFFYSEILGFEPCTLCWVQRIFLYPQVIMLGLALWKRDYRVSDYSLGLSIPGALIAFYHYFGQMFNTSALPCKTAEAISSCTQRFVLEFGYVTIPMMAFTTFMALIALMCIHKLEHDDRNSGTLSLRTTAFGRPQRS
jgi:disulfide bond formation protein DsbB